MFESARILPFGERALLLESPAPAQLLTQQAYHLLRQELLRLDWVSQVVTGFNNLTIFLVDSYPLPQAQAELAQLLRQPWSDTPARHQSSILHRIPLRYGGESGIDLAALASHARLSEAEVIALHSSQIYTVYCLGFQPGFAYLGDLNPVLHMPRRAEPRLRVPAGSVAIGGAQTGIYPSVSPGGWNLIGQTDLALFDIQAEPPCLLKAGDQVQFYPI